MTGGPREREAGLQLEPAAVLPHQFFASISRDGARKGGEFQLVAAVLEDAVFCFQKYLLSTRPHQRQLFREAEAWLMGRRADRRGGDDGLTFEYVCEVLGLECATVRSGLERWRHQQLRGKPRPSVPIAESA
jgi:hypothetical protein